MSLIPGKRISIPLSGNTSISGTITLVLSEESIDLHIPQELKKKTLPKTSPEAVDFGYTEVMTDTQGIRYGTQFGTMLTQGSEDRHQKMQKRHKLHAIEKKKKIAIQKKQNAFENITSARKSIAQLPNALRATLEKEINTAINQLIQTKKPFHLNHRRLDAIPSSTTSPKQVNRKLSILVERQTTRSNCF